MIEQINSTRIEAIVSEIESRYKTTPLDHKHPDIPHLVTIVRDLLNAPIPMLLWCPECGNRHIDEGEFATKHHHTHACQHCGIVWRPAIVSTIGVRFLPGFKNA